MPDDPLLTWAALLGKWTEFARASVALPTTGEGRRWRASVAPVISLQAVTLALGDLERLAHDERPLALDRAEVAIDADERTLRQAWESAGLPDKVEELLADARAALGRAEAQISGS